MAQTSNAPTSYKDPFWTDLASGVESKLGLPGGLLAAVVTKGERSNADQVSEAGAKTPFQIIPATRDAVLKKYGIDAYLNPQNAAEAAGLLLKESLDRNKGDVVAAVGEYHGGTDRKQWGPRTKSYIARVLNDSSATQAGAPASGGTMFQRAVANQQQASMAPGSIASVYDAYRSGKMTPSEAADFEADVKAGLVMLPRGAALKGQQPKTGTGATKPEPVTLPQAITDAYVNGKLSEQERVDLEADMRAGIVKLPPNSTSQIPGEGDWKPPTEQGIIPRIKEPTLGERLLGTGEAALTTVTGMTGGTVGMVAGTVEGITKSIMDGTFGTPQAADRTEQIAMQRAGQLTFQPRTEQGMEQAQAVGGAMQQLMPLAPLTGEMAALNSATRLLKPTAQVTGAAAVDMAKQGATKVAETVKPPVVAAVQAVKNAPQRVMEMAGLREPMQPTPAGAADGRVSMGAANVPQDMVRAQKAANLPKPIDLTLGAETRDAAQLAFEKEQMKNPELGAPLRQRANENNLQALQNFDQLIDMTDAQAPDLVTTGNTVTKALAEGYKRAKTAVRTAYKAAEKAGEMEAPVQLDGIAKLLTETAPEAEVAPILKVARQKAINLGALVEGPDGTLTAQPAPLKTVELLRRSIGESTGYEPTNRLFGGRLRESIDIATEGMGGDLYKQARALRQAQARKYENRAVVARLIQHVKGMDDPKVAADQVFQKSIMGASPEEITFLKRVLNTSGSDGQQAWKELQGALIRNIRDEATKGMGMDAADNPIVSPAKLNQTIQTLDKNGRLDIVLGKKNAEIVRDLNDVVKYVNTVPPGTLVNNSGTAMTLMAAIGEAGATGALTGLPVPAVSLLKALGRQIKDNKTRLKINRALNAKPTNVPTQPKF